MKSDKRHILYLSSWYPNKNEPLLGNYVHNHAKSVAKEFQISALHVTSFVQTEAIVIEKKEVDNVFSVNVYYQKVEETGGGVAFKKLYRRIQAYRKGFQLIENEKGKIDLAHLNVVFPAGIFMLFLYLFKDIKYVVTEHWSGYLQKDGGYGKSTIFQKYITKTVMKNAKLVLPVSAVLKESLKKHHFYMRKLKVIPNVVDCTVFKPVETEDNKEDKIKFLHVSNLKEVKNIIGILEAIKRITLTRKQIKLTIICDENREKYENLATSMKLKDKHVFFKGPLTPFEIAKEMQQADALIQFSTYETFGIVAIEALACGLPVITTPVGIAKELTQQKEVITVETKSVESLINGMMEIVNENVVKDKKKMHQYIKEHFSEEVVGMELGEVYKKNTI